MTMLLRSFGLLVLFNSILFFHLKTHGTTSACRSLLSLNKAVVQNENSSELLIGILVETSDGTQVLATGVYVTGSHKGIFNTIAKKLNYEISKILWAGELRVRGRSQGVFIISEANQTSGFIYRLMSGENEGLWLLTDDSLDVFNLDVEVMNESERLIEFGVRRGILTPSFAVLSYSPGSEHLYEPFNSISGNNRHNLGNHIQMIGGTANLVGKVPSAYKRFKGPVAESLVFLENYYSAKLITELRYMGKDQIEALGNMLENISRLQELVQSSELTEEYIRVIKALESQLLSDLNLSDIQSLSYRVIDVID